MVTLQEDLNLQYLITEIKQMDFRVRHTLHQRLNTGKQELDRFRGLYISQQEVLDLAQALQRENALQEENALQQENASQEENNPGETEQEKGEDEAFLLAIQTVAAESKKIEQEAQNSGVKLRLQSLRELFSLTNFEYHAFLACLLPAIDLRYERVYGFLQDDVTKKQAGLDLIFLLWDASTALEVGRLRWLVNFSARGTLIRYHLLRPVNPLGEWQEPRLNQLFEVAPAVVAWLTGQYFPEEIWLHLTPWEQIQEVIAGDRFAEQFVLDWEKVIENRPMLSFVGPDEERQRLAARKVAFQFNMPILEVDLRDLPGEEPFHLPMLRLMVRDACLSDAIIFIQGWERVLDANGFVPSDILEEMALFGGIFILSSQHAWRISYQSGRPVFQISFDMPTSEERMWLWQHSFPTQIPLPEETLRDLAGQFALTSGQIQNAAYTVRNAAFQSGNPLSASDFFLAARQQSAHHLNELAQKIEQRYTWDNIVLPPDELRTLHDIVSMMRYRPLVLENWGLGKQLTSNKGISALFAGDPGTGKTLAAQVVSSSLQLDLYRIDLSRIVSKYIGETEKNLDRIFEEAANSNAILFFDEADAIFGKRSEVKDAHDRYANIEVGYLLQRMETYDGVTILATNLRTNLDDAFTRRLNFIVNFPLPDEAHRLKIWKVLLPPDLPVDPQIDWPFLAQRYAIPGGNIRNILVTAAFLAARKGSVLTMDHLLEATRQEMQKMGRLIKEEEFLYSQPVRFDR